MVIIHITAAIFRLIIHTTVAIFAAVILINFIDHYYDTNGKKKPVREPFFMPKNSEKYYRELKYTLSTYLFCTFAQSILKSGEDELRNTFRLYKNNCTNTANWQYVKDMCECTSYENWFFESWATIYVLSRLNIMLSHYSIISNAETPNATKLLEELEKRYQIIVEDDTLCPRSFIENYFFLPNA